MAPSFESTNGLTVQLYSAPSTAPVAQSPVAVTASRGSSREGSVLLLVPGGDDIGYDTAYRSPSKAGVTCLHFGEERDRCTTCTWCFCVGGVVVR
jgi:hypothetical protein